jgi:hypothetical protein
MDEHGHGPREEYVRLVEASRSQCLWFLREDYLPDDPEGMCRVLGYIRRYGDRESFRVAGKLIACLSPDSSGPSAAS